MQATDTYLLTIVNSLKSCQHTRDKCLRKPWCRESWCLQSCEIVCQVMIGRYFIQVTGVFTSSFHERRLMQYTIPWYVCSTCMKKHFWLIRCCYHLYAIHVRSSQSQQIYIAKCSVCVFVLNWNFMSINIDLLWPKIDHMSRLCQIIVEVFSSRFRSYLHSLNYSL